MIKLLLPNLKGEYKHWRDADRLAAELGSEAVIVVRNSKHDHKLREYGTKKLPIGNAGGAAGSDTASAGAEDSARLTRAAAQHARSGQPMTAAWRRWAWLPDAEDLVVAVGKGPGRGSK